MCVKQLFNWSHAIPLLVWFLVFVACAYPGVVPDSPDTGSERVAELLAGSAFCFSYALLLGALIPRRPTIVRALLAATLVSVYSLCVLYAIHTHDFLRVPLFVNHFDSIFFPDTFSVIFNGQTFWYWVIASFTFILVAVLSQRFDEAPRSLISRAVACVPVLIIIPFTFKYNIADPMAILVQSGAKYVSLRNNELLLANVWPPTSVAGEGSLRESERPNIFLLILESMPGKFLNVEMNGTVVTPILNKVAERAIVIPRFYGNSTYTISGQASILTSSLPPLSGNLSSSFSGVPLQSLPERLKEIGYKCLFLSAQADLEFANTRAFMERIGFEGIYSAASDPSVRPTFRWGWGIQDDEFYRSAFRQFDKVRTSHAGPMLATFATVVNHTPYDQLPSHFNKVWPKPVTGVQMFGNSVHSSDAAIKVFLDELERRGLLEGSIVIITSDHAMPVGEHSSPTENVRCYEENFLVPCMLLIPGTNGQLTFPRPSYSQLDIFPTILELLGMPRKEFMLGVAIQNTDYLGGSILVQQNGAGYAVYNEYPFKYVYEFYTGKEFLYRLDSDPLERFNLLRSHSARASEMQRGLQILFAYDRYVRSYDFP